MGYEAARSRERRLLSARPDKSVATPGIGALVGARRRAFLQAILHLAIVAGLLCLAILNLRANWSEAEDGVLWKERNGSVVAVEVLPDYPGAQAQIREGDILEAIDGRPVFSDQDVVAALHAAKAGQTLRYSIVRLQDSTALDVRLDPVPSHWKAHYFLLASVGIFTLLVGTGVRLRRPGNQATLHFFWLTVAFFGVLALSFTGRFDRLDWAFYWGDVVAMLLLPPLFVHFALIFPERAESWKGSDAGRTTLTLLYLPPLLLGAARVAVVAKSRNLLSNVIPLLERIEILYLALSLAIGLVVMTRALGRVRSVTAR